MLPYQENKVLLQLRDPKPWIVHPGRWGFFSGAINPGEEPREAALRELQEELCYRPQQLLKLTTEKVPGLAVCSHVYFCPLEVPLQNLSLREGQDFGLFSWKEISTKKLYSLKLRRFYPLIDSPWVLGILRRVLEKVSPQSL